jgi:uncharacterized membrane protein
LNTIIVAILIGISFIFWPLAGKYSGAPAAWVCSIVMIGTGVTGTILSWPALTKSQMPSLQTVGLLILASILNGLGVWAYSIKSTDLAIRTSGFIITVSITMIMISAIVGFILLNENINGRYVLAIFTGILTVYLMNS